MLDMPFGDIGRHVRQQLSGLSQTELERCAATFEVELSLATHSEKEIAEIICTCLIQDAAEEMNVDDIDEDVFMSVAQRLWRAGFGEWPPEIARRRIGELELELRWWKDRLAAESPLFGSGSCATTK